MLYLNIQMQIELDEIGIIAPYRAHVNLLKKIIIKDIEINTVDQYQGRDKQIIIYSCAKSLLNNKDIEEVIYLNFTLYNYSLLIIIYYIKLYKLKIFEVIFF